MNRNLPSRAQRLHCRQTRIVQPALIEEICGAVWTSGPCQCRDGVDYEANVLYISRFFEAMLHKDAIARIIDPYGGPIGPKLHCSCPPGMTAELYRGRSKTSSFQFEGEIVSGFNAGNRIGTGKRACIEWSGHLTGGRPFGSYPSAWWLAPGVGDHLVLLRCRFQDLR